ncbi:MAG: beta-N-acetylhexosaminidase [Gammaproteobacteria bacterium]
MTIASGPLIVDITGPVLVPEDREVLEHPSIGGVILFTRNYEGTSQLAALCRSLHALRPRAPLLVTVDHEGGRVQRFRTGFTDLPAAARCADAAAAHAQGQTLARELRACGVDLSFAPVLDVDRGLGSVIGDRAFGVDPGEVAELGAAWAAGMRAGGMAACGKHFPGHGGVAGDSHHELPVDPRSLDEISGEDLVPFRTAIGAGIESLMMAHVLFPAVDAMPASLSRRWIGEILRGQLAFDGAIVCDDLSMAGASGFGGYADRAAAALDAGCDALPVCNNRGGVIEIIESVRIAPDRTRAARLARLAPR